MTTPTSRRAFAASLLAIATALATNPAQAQERGDRRGGRGDGEGRRSNDRGRGDGGGRGEGGQRGGGDNRGGERRQFNGGGDRPRPDARQWGRGAEGLNSGGQDARRFGDNDGGLRGGPGEGDRPRFNGGQPRPQNPQGPRGEDRRGWAARPDGDAGERRAREDQQRRWTGNDDVRRGDNQRDNNRRGFAANDGRGADGGWRRDGDNRGGDRRDGGRRDNDRGPRWADDRRRRGERVDFVRQHGGRHDWGRNYDWDRRYVRQIRSGRYFNVTYVNLCSRYYGRPCRWYGAGWYGPWNRPWRVGYVLPANCWYEPIPYELYYDMPPCPYGYDYCRVSTGDILLISLITGLVIDALLFG